MTTTIHTQEILIQELQAKKLSFLINNYSLSLELRRITPKTSGVSPSSLSGEYDHYGVDYGDVDDKDDSLELVDTIAGIITGDNFTPTDPFSNAIFGGSSEIALYTKSTIVLSGDIIKVVRTKSRRYKVDVEESLGITKEVFKRWRLLTLGD